MTLPPGPDNDENTATKQLDRLLSVAEAGGPQARVAARRAALLAEGRDFARARRALAAAARLDPLDAGPRLALARLNAEAGDADAARTEALAVFKDAVDQAQRARAAFMLGEIDRAQGARDAARLRYGEALAIETALLAAAPNDPIAARWYARAKGRLAELDAAAGDKTAARLGAETALGMLRAVATHIGEEPVLAADIADAQLRLAALEVEAGQTGAARERLGQAIGRYEALAVVEPEEPHWRAVLADAWALSAEAAFAERDGDAARADMDKALQLRLKLAAADPHERWALAATWRLRAALMTALIEGDAARDSILHARALATALCAETRDAAAWRFLIATLLEQADIALRSREFEQAREAADAARQHAENFARADAGWHPDLASAWERLALIAREAKAAGSARSAIDRALDLRRKVRAAAADEESERAAKRALAFTLAQSGDLYNAAVRLPEARKALEEHFLLRLELAESAPGDLSAARNLAVALERLGLIAAAMGDTAGARVAWEEEFTLAERVFSGADNLEGERFRAVIESHIASLGGVDAAARRASALARLDRLASVAALTNADVKLRAKLWKA